MISAEYKKSLIENRLIPTYEEIAKECRSSVTTVTSVMNGSTANTKVSRRIESYIRDTASEAMKQLKKQERELLSA